MAINCMHLAFLNQHSTFILMPTSTNIVYVQEVSTEELQAALDVTIDKKAIEQLHQAHKELKIQLQTTSRVAEKKKAMLKKQKEQNKGTIKAASLQVIRSFIQAMCAHAM